MVDHPSILSGIVPISHALFGHRLVSTFVKPAMTHESDGRLGLNDILGAPFKKHATMVARYVKMINPKR